MRLGPDGPVPQPGGGGGGNPINYPVLTINYAHGADPNVIRFEIALTNALVQTANPSLPLNVLGGVPAYAAVLVNDSNPADAVWRPYSGSSVVATLGAAGDYTVSVGLRGFPANAAESWQTVPRIENTTSGHLTNGLVAYWRLNDGSGTNAVDQVAGNNLTLKTTGTSLPTWGPGYLSFDGASQYCDGGNQPAFNVTNNERSITVSIWPASRFPPGSPISGTAHFMACRPSPMSILGVMLPVWEDRMDLAVCTQLFP